MEKPTLDQVKRDPEFYKIDRSAMRSVLEDLDPEYLGLPEEEKNDVVNSLHNNMPSRYIPGTEMFEPEPPVSTYKFDMEYEKRIGDLVADIAPPVAATIGGGLGFGAGAGLASYPLSMGGAGLGGMVGEAYKTIWYGATGEEKTPETPTEYFKRIGKVGLEEMAWESIGLAVGLPIRAVRGAKNIIGRVGKKTTTEYGQLSPGETMDEGWLRTAMENIENIGSLGKHKIEKARKLKIIREAVRRNIHESPKTPESLKNLLYDSLMDENKAWQDLCQSSYGDLNTYLTKVAQKTGKSDKFISTAPLKESARNMLNYAKRIGTGSELAPELERILHMEDFISFRAAKLQWGRMRGNSVDRLSKPYDFMRNQFKDDVGKQIEVFDPSGVGKNLWKTSDTLYKEGKKMFNEMTMKELMYGPNSAELYGHIIRPHNGENVNKMKELLLGQYELALYPEALKPTSAYNIFNPHWKKLQNITYNKLLGDAISSRNILSGKKLKQGYKELGSTAKAIFEPFPDAPKELLNKGKQIEGFINHLVKLEPKTKLLNLTGITIMAPVVAVGTEDIMKGRDPGIESVGKIILGTGGIILTAAALGRLTRSKTGLKIMKEIAKTPIRAVEKLTTLTLRANNFLDRIEKRESWLEKRGKDMLKQGMEKRGEQMPVVPTRKARPTFEKPGRGEIIKELLE